jgi:hypothetical protein
MRYDWLLLCHIHNLEGLHCITWSAIYLTLSKGTFTYCLSTSSIIFFGFRLQDYTYILVNNLWKRKNGVEYTYPQNLSCITDMIDSIFRLVQLSVTISFNFHQ